MHKIGEKVEIRSMIFDDVPVQGTVVDNSKARQRLYTCALKDGEKIVFYEFEITTNDVVSIEVVHQWLSK